MNKTPKIIRFRLGMLHQKREGFCLPFFGGDNIGLKLCILTGSREERKAKHRFLIMADSDDATSRRRVALLSLIRNYSELLIDSSLRQMC